MGVGARGEKMMGKSMKKNDRLGWLKVNFCWIMMCFWQKNQKRFMIQTHVLKMGFVPCKKIEESWDDIFLLIGKFGSFHHWHVRVLMSDPACPTAGWFPAFSFQILVKYHKVDPKMWLMEEILRILIETFRSLQTMGYLLGGGFKHFLFLPLPGEMIQVD